MSLIGFIIAAIIILVVLYVSKLVIDFMELPPPLKHIVLVLISLLCLIALLNQVDIMGARMPIW